MKSLSPAVQDHILSLLDSGLSGHQISSQTGVCNATISRICSKHFPSLHKSSGGHPTKLSQTNIELFALLAQGELKMQSRSPKFSGMLSTCPCLHKQFEMTSWNLGWRLWWRRKGQASVGISQDSNNKSFSRISRLSSTGHSALQMSEEQVKTSTNFLYPTD